MTTTVKPPAVSPENLAEPALDATVTVLTPEETAGLRRAFRDALEAQKTATAEWARVQDRTEGAYVLECEAAWKGDLKLFKRPFNLPSFIELRPLAHEPIRAKWEAEAVRLVAERRIEEARLKTAVGKAAGKAPILPGKAWLLVRETRSSDYATQGFGASNYARCRAEVEAVEARLLGVEARVVPTEEKPPVDVTPLPSWASTGRHRRIFRVEARVQEDLDAELLSRRGVLTVLEWLQLCWCLGVNPRVYAPTLPPDLEDHHDVTYTRPIFKPSRCAVCGPRAACPVRLGGPQDGAVGASPGYGGGDEATGFVVTARPDAGPAAGPAAGPDADVDDPGLTPTWTTRARCGRIPSRPRQA